MLVKTENIFLNSSNLKNQKIKSFVLRRRKIKDNNDINFQKLWKKFGINFEKKILNFTNLFNNFNPIILEIGFGNGISLIKQAQINKNINFLGIEVYRIGIFSCMKYASLKNITNLKIIYFNAVDVLLNMIPNNSIYIIQIFFPDPWSKRKHNKRRLINKDFLCVINQKLFQFGFLYIMTDCFLYFQSIQYLLKSNLFFHKILEIDVLDKILFLKIITKFELRSFFLKRKIYYDIVQNYISYFI